MPPYKDGTFSCQQAQNKPQNPLNMSMINWSNLKRRDYASRYARFLARYPGWVMTVLLSLTALSLLVAIEWLQTDHSATAMFAPESQAMQLYKEYTDEFGEPDDLIVVAEHGTRQQRQEFMQLLAHRLEQEPLEKISNILFQIPVRSFATLLFAPDEEVDEIRAWVDDEDHIVNRLLATPNLEGFLGSIADRFEQDLQEESIKTDPAPFFKDGARLMPAFTETLKSPHAEAGPILLRWGSQIFDKFEEADEKGYLVADGGRLHLMFIKPADATGDTQKARELVDIVRDHIDVLAPEYKEMSVGLTGQPALTYDEFVVSERDMLWATLFALFTTALIFLLAFRNFAHPFYGFSCLVMSVCLTFGLTTVTIGHLNLISLSFAVILIGLGTQYGVHIIARYEEERSRGRSIPEAMEILVRQTVPSLLIGALTTSAAFYATMLIKFRGFRELAFIAGSGVLICFVIMSFALPAFLSWHDRHREVKQKQRRGWPLAPQLRTGVSRFYVGSVTRFPKLLLAGSGLISVLAVFLYLEWGPFPYFDYNLLNLQAKDVESVQFEKRLMETHVSPRFAIYQAHSQNEAKEIIAKLESRPEIGKVESLYTLMPSYTLEKLEKVRYIGHALHSRLSFGNRPTDPAAVVAALKRLQDLFADVEEKLFAGGYVEALHHAGEISASLAEAHQAVASLSEDEGVRRLNRIQESLGNELAEIVKAESERDVGGLGTNIPSSLRDRFLSPNYVYAIYAYPAHSIWNREGLRSFVQALEGISDRFSGPPLQMYEALSAMDSGWYRSALFAAIAIFILFLIDFRSLRWSLIATVPLLCGLTWIYGGMALFNIQWNIVNLIALPLVLGIGADCGIHLIHRYREQQAQDVSFVLSSTGKAVTVAYSDTITSFFGLAIASHQGLASLGRVIIWGIFCCYLAGMIVLPALLAAWPVQAAKAKQEKEQADDASND